MQISARRFDANALAAEYGTPLLAIDLDELDANIALFEEAAAAHGITVAYAAKALFFVALAKRLASTPFSIDVCSLGELVTAERGGVPPARLIFHGCGKTDVELDAIAAGRVRRTVVDHIDELRALAARAHADRPAAVLLRVNTGIEAHTHDFVRTAGQQTKFGFVPGELPEAVDVIAASPGLRLAGVHGHIGSQIFESAALEANVEALVDAYTSIRAASMPLGEISAGGGFGVGADGTPIAIGATLAGLFAALKRECDRRSVDLPALSIEPGRALVASAGTSIYRVITVKDRGSKRFAIVDGSLADNPRHALYDAIHPQRLIGRESAAALRETTVCGRSCESDVLGTAQLPQDLRAGDLIAFATTGAYTFSMASNYNRFVRPAVVFVRGAGHRLAVRRETIDEVLRNDVLDA
jgi:diaminopimelate decarboxylase